MSDEVKRLANEAAGHVCMNCSEEDFKLHKTWRDGFIAGFIAGESRMRERAANEAYLFDARSSGAIRRLQRESESP